MSNTPQLSRTVKRHADTALNIGSAVVAIANVMTNDQNKHFLSDSDKWGLADALKLIGESSVELSDRISSVEDHLKEEGQAND